MKKLIILSFFMCIGVFASANPDTLVVSVDSLQTVLDSLNANISDVETIGDVFKDGKDIIGYTVEFFGDVAYVIKNAPKPVDATSVSWWVEFSGWLLGALFSLLTTLMVAFFKLIQKDPKSALTVVGKLWAAIRTRYFVVIASVSVTLVGLFAFKEDAWTWGEAILYIVTSFFSGIGINQFFNWLKDWLGKMTNRK